MAQEDLIYFFTGEDESRKRLSIDKLKTRLSLTHESLDYNVYYSKDLSVEQLIDNLKTPPFLGKHRLVILKDAEKLSEADKERLISYLKKPSKTSIFVILTKKDLNSYDKLNTAAKEYARCIDFLAPQQDKISQTLSVFSLLEQISSKNKSSALKTLILLMQSGKNAHEILGLLAWYIRRLGKTKVLLKKGVGGEEIASSLKVSNYTARNIINQAKNFNFGELKRAQRLLIETDQRLKRSALRPEVLLEMLVASLG